jgi:hypothetical protein
MVPAPSHIPVMKAGAERAGTAVIRLDAATFKKEEGRLSKGLSQS